MRENEKLRRIRLALARIDNAVALFEKECASAGAYMPSVADRFQIYADEFREKYNSDMKGGKDE